MSKDRDFFWRALAFLGVFALGILAGGIVGVGVGAHNVRAFEVAPLQAQLEIVFSSIERSTPAIREITNKLDGIVKAVERASGLSVRAVRVRSGPDIEGK